MLLKSTLLLAAAAASVQAASIPIIPGNLEPRQQRALCELYGYWSGNGYELLNNLWGRDTATSGWQCTYLDGTNNGGIQWSSAWEWQGAPDNVKSYPYVGKQFQRGRKISDIRSMQTSVSWSYDRTDVRANVAYDVFTARDPEHPNWGGDYELMIWLARYGGIWPIGQVIAQVNLAGRNWDLYAGYNGNMRVYSFLPPNNAVGDIRNFSCDIKDFFNYLEQNHGYPAREQNLIVYQIGTECFTGGPAKFTCHNFKADLW
ncbi:hypothetical protein VTJ83DRAFT_2453 [Remersonia thermophila]|uniref:Uncharacterized protein n=1 Tax=Remersonia thermophila TaxID=72144 RepID=A0ABR4DLV2_9PEZI